MHVLFHCQKEKYILWNGNNNNIKHKKKCNEIDSGKMTHRINEHTKLKTGYQVSWARLLSFCQLDLISDPNIYSFLKPPGIWVLFITNKNSINEFYSYADKKTK